MPGGTDPEEKWLAEVIKANEAMKEKAKNSGGGSGSTSAGASSSTAGPSRSSSTPHSVRNAPSDMRAEIRRVQNRDVSLSYLSKN